MASVKPNLQAQSESYLARLQRRNAKFQDRFINFLKHDTRKLLVIEMGSMLLSISNVRQILSNLEEYLKTRYDGGANSIFLSWEELVSDIGGSEVIPKFPNLVVLEFDKSAIDEQDMKVLNKIGERLSTGPSWKKVILVASEKGRLNNVLQQLQSDVIECLEEPTYKNIPGSTRKSKSLCEAASKGFLHEVEMFIENGADINQVDDDGNTALHMAAQNGHNEIVFKLLKNDAKYLHDKKNDTALHLAAKHGHVDIVIALLEYGADVNGVIIPGCTPLHLASQNGHHDVVRTLILYDANIQATGKSRYTALYYAASKGHETVVNTLLEFGARVDTKDEIGRTPLHIAGSAGYLEVVILLIEMAHANLNCEDITGRTPLDWAKFVQHTETVAYLTSKRAM